MLRIFNKGFINPFTDFGFKKIFGEEYSRDLLIDFLNSLYLHPSPIESLIFLKDGQLGRSEFDKIVLYFMRLFL